MMIVVGAGPSGLLTARDLAKEGFTPTIFEEHLEIGIPEQCTGIVSKEGLKKLGVDFKPAIRNKFTSAVLHSPKSFVVLKSTTVRAYGLCRHCFDKLLAEDALSQGANLINKRFDYSGYKFDKILVAADGANSFARKLVGKSLELYFSKQYTFKNPGNWDDHTVHLYFNPQIALGFFAWVAPYGDILKVGVALPKSQSFNAFDSFISNFGFGNPESISGGPIPVQSLDKFVFGKLLLVGDAAGIVKSTTGGGIALGGLSGILAAKSIIDFYENASDLTQYEQLLSTHILSNLKKHRVLHNILLSLSSSQLDNIFDTFRKSKLPYKLSNADIDDAHFIVKSILTTSDFLLPSLLKISPSILLKSLQLFT